MKRKIKLLLTVAIIFTALFLVLDITVGFPSLVPPALDFPVLESDNVTRFSAFYTPDWGEPGVYHNGIDLVISQNVTIIAPANGLVISITENVNPYAGNVLFSIIIMINPAWTVKLVIEPGFLDPTNNSLQSANIRATLFQVVKPGDNLATLLYSENYPHLHYMLNYLGMELCAYDYSSPATKEMFEIIASNSSTTISYPYPQPMLWLSPLLLTLGFCGAMVGIIVLFIQQRRVARK